MKTMNFLNTEDAAAFLEERLPSLRDVEKWKNWLTSVHSRKNKLAPPDEKDPTTGVVSVNVGGTPVFLQDSLESLVLRFKQAAAVKKVTQRRPTGRTRGMSIEALFNEQQSGCVKVGEAATMLEKLAGQLRTREQWLSWLSNNRAGTRRFMDGLADLPPAYSVPFLRMSSSTCQSRDLYSYKRDDIERVARIELARAGVALLSAQDVTWAKSHLAKRAECATA